ncbi:hypothetical protein JCM33774_25680 [Actinophytocola sp. KF-1]
MNGEVVSFLALAARDFRGWVFGWLVWVVEVAECLGDRPFRRLFGAWLATEGCVAYAGGMA